MLLQSFIKELVVVLPFYPVFLPLCEFFSLICPSSFRESPSCHTLFFLHVLSCMHSLNYSCPIPSYMIPCFALPEVCPHVCQKRPRPFFLFLFIPLSGGHHGAHGSRRPSGHGQHLRANVQQPAVLRAPHAAPHLRPAHFAGAIRKFGLVLRGCW